MAEEKQAWEGEYMSATGPTEDEFLKNVEKHEMNVLLDSGMHRHLRFKQPGSSLAWFDIVTWPGYLAYAGDMGSFVFCRLPDMFQLFRAARRKDGSLNINRSYWGEKLEAVDRRSGDGSHREFSFDLMRQCVEEAVAAWIAEYPVGFYEMSEEEIDRERKAYATALREAVAARIEPYLDDGEHEARRVVRDFVFSYDGHTKCFQDTWEWNCEDYTYRFTWCCYALAWAIEKYDAALAGETVPSPVEVRA